jgi:hypothetical protein
MMIPVGGGRTPRSCSIKSGDARVRLAYISVRDSARLFSCFHSETFPLPSHWIPSMRGFAFVPCLFLMCTAIVGCSVPTNAPPPPLAKVSGKVTLDGKAMDAAKVNFSVGGQAPIEFDVKNGEFSGEAFVGKNSVQVVLQKDGPPATTDKAEPTKISLVGPHILTAEVTKDGPNSFTFDVPAAP